MKILQVVLNLDYGGVESYVIRLSRAMVQAGHDVTVLSQGGPMATLLDGTGVGLITRPLDREAIPQAIEDVSGKGFEIINAHNYNSGRAGCPIACATNTPYVMTVHGPRGFFRRVFYNCWSDRVIALSGSDKRGISGFMGRPMEHILTGVYPIATDVHYPREIPLEKKLEFVDDPSGKLIVHISRFSNRKARVAFELIKAMPAILAKEPGTRLLIVGSGPMFDEIKKRADEFNERHNASLNSLSEEGGGGVRPQLIRVDGPRLDVSDLFNMADVVVATATTAMEAMTCGAPLIAAGRTGYFGPMTDERFDEGHDVLFADHGRCPRQTSAELLAADVLRVLDDLPGARSAAAEIAARMARDFSPASAADNAILLYERVIREAR